MLRHPRFRLAAVLLATIALVAGCGDDDDAATDDDSTTTTPAAEPAAGKTITVTGVDYKYEGLPAEMEAGTKLEFKNGSTKEVHELVAFRIPDSETRPMSELVALPEEQTEAIFGSGPPAAVLIAPPAGEVIQAVGDGTFTAPGRYGIACFIPTGADPAAYLAALQAATDGPPDVAGGPPHVANGMFAEVKVS